MFCVGKGRKLKQRGLWDRQQMAVSQTAPTTASCSPERAVMFPSSGIAVFRVRLSYLESLEVCHICFFGGSLREELEITAFLLLGYASSFASKGLEKILVGLALLEGFLFHV